MKNPPQSSRPSTTSPGTKQKIWAAMPYAWRTLINFCTIGFLTGNIWFAVLGSVLGASWGYIASLSHSNYLLEKDSDDWETSNTARPTYVRNWWKYTFIWGIVFPAILVVMFFWLYS